MKTVVVGVFVASDRVVLPSTPSADTRGPAQVPVTHCPGSSDAFADFTVGSDLYLIPSEAAASAGRVLGLSLFVRSNLAAAQTPGAHRPVQLRIAAAVTPAAPAGVTV